jgi:hypothetical protein
MRRATLRIMEAMQAADEPLGHLPRKGKVAILKVLRALNEAPEFAMRGAGESETKARVTRDADRLIGRYVDELERLTKRSQAAKSLGEHDYPGAA